MPVMPRAISFAAAACPPSSENRVRSTSPSASAIARNPTRHRLEGGQLPPRRDVIRRPDDEPDPLVTERGEVGVRLLHRDGVVGRHAREVEMVGRSVHEDDRQPQLEQARVVLVRRIGLGVLTSREDHPRDLPLEQHLDVLGLRHAPRPRAQHRVEAALRQRPGHDLSECGEDRVLQLRDDQADHAGLPPAQVRRPLVADHVQRRQDGGSRCVGDRRDGRSARG